MYGEEWESAEHSLQTAKRQAITIKDKVRIDVALDLLGNFKKEKITVP